MVTNPDYDAQLASETRSTRDLIRIESVNSAGALEYGHFWTGADAQTIQVEMDDGALNAFQFTGFQTLLEIGSVKANAGTTIEQLGVTLSGITPETLDSVVGYDARGKRFWYWRAEYNGSGVQQGHAGLLFFGVVDEVTSQIGAIGGNNVLNVTAKTFISTMKPNPLKRDMASQKTRSSTDSFLAYADQQYIVDAEWG